MTAILPSRPRLRLGTAVLLSSIFLLSQCVLAQDMPVSAAGGAGEAPPAQPLFQSRVDLELPELDGDEEWTEGRGEYEESAAKDAQAEEDGVNHWDDAQLPAAGPAAGLVGEAESSTSAEVGADGSADGLGVGKTAGEAASSISVGAGGKEGNASEGAAGADTGPATADQKGQLDSESTEGGIVVDANSSGVNATTASTAAPESVASTAAAGEPAAGAATGATAAPDVGAATGGTAAPVAASATGAAVAGATAAPSAIGGGPVGQASAADAMLESALNVTVFAMGDGKDGVAAYERGKMVGKFAACGKADKSDMETICDVAPEYADRNTVQLKFDTAVLNGSVLMDLLNNFHVGRMVPVASSEGGRAHPVVVNGWKIDDETATVTMVVKYGCHFPAEDDTAKNSSSLVKLHLPLSVSRFVQLSWVKKCGSGHFEHLDFGYLNHEKKTVLFHHDGTHGERKEVGLEVSPHDLSTVLTLALRDGVGALDFQAPYVTSSKPDLVKFSVRGALNQGTLSLTPSEPAEVSIMYECKAAVTADFDVTIGIPPWTNLTASWTKDCGGQIAKSLLIGTGIAQSFDVLHDGELAPMYNVSGIIGSPNIMRPAGVKEVDSNTHQGIYYVTNVDETSPIHIQSVTVTTDPSSILSVAIEKPSIQPVIGDGYITKEGGILRRKEAQRLSLQYYCRATGSVVVLVTLSTLLYQNVEFGFVKDCVEGRVFHQSALTAGSLMTALFLAAILTAVLSCCYVVQRRKREAALLDAAVGKGGRRKGTYTLVDDAGLDF